MKCTLNVSQIIMNSFNSSTFCRHPRGFRALCGVREPGRAQVRHLQLATEAPGRLLVQGLRTASGRPARDHRQRGAHRDQDRKHDGHGQEQRRPGGLRELPVRHGQHQARHH